MPAAHRTPPVRRPAGAVDRVVVVVPAHDEQLLLPAALAALRRAAADVDVPVQLVVVLDACRDRTAEVAGPGVLLVPVEHRNVGAARAAGFAAAGVDDRTWCASTDADTVVGRGWIAGHLRLARSGADVVAGTVEVDDWSRHPAELRARYEAGYANADGHRHVHGANLGISGRAYRALGGFAPLAAHEDVDLVDRALRAGCTVRWTARVGVRTSARTDGRAPDGFARHLRELAVAR